MTEANEIATAAMFNLAVRKERADTNHQSTTQTPKAPDSLANRVPSGTTE